MSKIEINLPPALAEFVQRQVEAGLFNSVEDVVEDAVRRASAEIWPPESDKLAALRAALAPGMAEAEAGIVYEGTIDDIIAEARAAAAQRR